MIALLVITSGAAAARKKDPDDKKVRTPRPELRLSADVQAGFAPLTIHFTARLKNVAPDAEAFCHAGSFLMLAGRDRPRILAGQDPACLHPVEDKQVSLTFSHTFTALRSGFFEFLAVVKTKDGLSIFSNRVPVRILSSPGGG